MSPRAEVRVTLFYNRQPNFDNYFIRPYFAICTEKNNIRCVFTVGFGVLRALGLARVTCALFGVLRAVVSAREVRSVWPVLREFFSVRVVCARFGVCYVHTFRRVACAHFGA
jgi:hypothetical protein